MGKEIWKNELKTYFDSVKIIEKCKAEAMTNFDQFCEFIAEPAFESLAEELIEYEVKAKFWREKGKSIHLQLNFPRSKTDNFHYVIALPKNSVELKLCLRIKGRKNPHSDLEQIEVPFMKSLKTTDVLKLGRDALLEDVIEHYRDFNFEALTSPD